jgi:adenylosuccinate lyase
VSGAVGTFASVDPRVELRVAERFGLRPEPVSTQVIPRDRHAAFVSALALLAAGIERVAVEVRHLQRSEVREAEEFFHAGQKGSSAMPHKRNPVLSENLTGLTRMIRAAVVPALENVALWHERDISHSAVERVMLPDACVLADFALDRLAGLVASSRSTRSGCGRTSTRRGASTTRSACSWRSPSAGCRGSRPTRWSSAARCGPGRRGDRCWSCSGRTRR